MENPERTITHLQNSLENVQGNIRHIDTKVAGAMGLVAVVLGFCVSRPVLASLLRFSEPISPLFRVPELILVVCAVVVLVFAVYYASKTLFPRMGSDPRLKGKTWLLFPLAKTDGEAVILRDSLESKAVKGMSDEKIVEEYLDQLAIIGYIQTQKMDACKSLFKCAWVFCGIMLLLGAISLLCHMNLPLHFHCGTTCPDKQKFNPSPARVTVPDRPSISSNEHGAINRQQSLLKQ